MKFAVIAASALSLLAACAAAPAFRSVPAISNPPVEPVAAAVAPPNEEPQPVRVNPTPPPCTCAEAGIKPKLRPKPKPRLVRREAPPQPPTAPTSAGPPAGAVIDAQVKSLSVAVMSMLGKRVQGPKGEDLGRVVDVLADATGRVRIAVIDFGGFLGVGNHRIAVDWPLLRFNPGGSEPSLVLSLDRDQLKAAPEYKENPKPQILMEPAPAPAGSPAHDPQGNK